MADVVITGFSNATHEGVVLHLNKKTRLKGGNMSTDEFWVSWDKIGAALFEGYTTSCDMDELRRIREESRNGPPSDESAIFGSRKTTGIAMIPPLKDMG